MLRALIGAGDGDETVASLRELLMPRTEGNPFFLEESVRSLFEIGALTGEPNKYRLVKPVRSVQMPGTVEELLAARIDRLGADDKRFLQYAAVVGKDAPVAVLARVAGLPVESVLPVLRRLQSAEFLYEKTDTPEAQYTFRHALTHEAAYGTLLERDRRAIHVQVLAAMEAVYASRLQEHVEALGHHALRGERWAKAVDYLRRAGAKSFALSTNRKAVSYLEEALTALRQLPPDEQPPELAVDLRFELRNALQPLGELEAMRRHLLEAHEAATALGDRRRLGRAAAYLADHFRLTGDHAEALRWGQQALDVAAGLGDLALEVNASTYLGQIHLIRGDYRRAIPFFERNIARLGGDLAAERFGTPQPASVHNRTCLTWCLAELGEFSEGLAQGEAGVQIAESLGQPSPRVTAYAGIGYLKVLRGDAEQAVQILETAVQLARDAERPLWFPRVASGLGYAYSLVGRIGDSIEIVEAALGRALLMRLVNGRALMQSILADARLRAGQVDRAEALAREALRLAQDQQERGHEVWIRWVLGRAVLERGGAAAREEALDHLRASLDRASDLGMRPLAALVHLTLGQALARAESGRTQSVTSERPSSSSARWA